MTVNQLATHVPDLVMVGNQIKALPHSQRFDGVLMFADISGFTALTERYSMSSRNSTCGAEKLSAALNSYIGDIVDNIIGSEGDILKFAGDAFLALWKLKRDSLDYTLMRVIKCGLRIQERCDNRETEVGVKLRVKLGVSLGPVRVTTVGNEESRHYVLSGLAVDDANKAEKFATSGSLVLSPKTWAYTPDHQFIEHLVLEDRRHVSVLSMIAEPINDPGTKIDLSYGNQYTRDMRKSGDNLTAGPSVTVVRLSCSKPASSDEHYADAVGRKRECAFRSSTDDEKSRLRMYVIKPVLQKIDDGLPLEYLSEMRQVSVVFINLVVTSSDHDSERRNLHKAFNVVYDDMKEYQGCVNKVFMFDKGCTFLAIFGLPGYKHEDDCARALQCSYRLLEHLKATPNVTQASIGVTTGSTFCGVIGHVHRHEYTVIGRKVNMAARLMMHYPGRVSCDPETFHHSKLARHFFRELPHKEMKGVRNAGVIQEFVEGEQSEVVVGSTVPEFEYPLLGRDKEMGVFLNELQMIQEHRERGEHRRVIIFDGQAGIGKTRMLDSVIVEAARQGNRVISCALTMNDVTVPYYTVKHLVTMLLEMEDCVSHVEREHALLEHIQNEALREDLCLLNDLLVLKLPTNPRFHNMKSEQRIQELHSLIGQIVHQFTLSQCVIFAVDDAHFIDPDSWDFLTDFAEDSSAVCVLTMRPFKPDRPPCVAAHRVLLHANTLHIKLGGLRSAEMASLACQLLDVVSVPEDLVRILQKKSHGIASWCEQLLQELTAANQLLIVPEGSLQAAQAEDQTSHVTPSLAVLQKRRDSSVNGGAPSRSRRSSVDSGTSPMFQQQIAPTLLERLQELQEEGLAAQEEDDEAKMVCVVASEVKMTDIQIPDSMTGMMLARIDHMKPSEQMMVKCAAVLGLTFTCRMLELIVPNTTPWKIRRLLHALMKAGVFECATYYMTIHGTTQRPSQGMASSVSSHFGTLGHGNRLSAGIICHCPKTERPEAELSSVDASAGSSHMFVTDCSNLRFTSAFMQETAYGLFLAEQRRKLHRQAAEFLESQAHKCVACGGGDFLPGGHQLTEETTLKVATTKKTSSDHAQHEELHANKDTNDKPGGSHTNAGRNTRHVSFDKVRTEQDTFVQDRTENMMGSLKKSLKRRKVASVSPNTEEPDGSHILIHEEEDSDDEVRQPATKPKTTPRGVRGRRGTLVLRKGSLDRNISVISFGEVLDSPAGSRSGSLTTLDFEQMDLRECRCTDVLNSVYPQLVRHWRAACHTVKTVHFLSEAGSAAVATGNNMQALSYLQEAVDIISDIDRGHNPLTDDPTQLVTIDKQERAKIESTMGQALFKMNRLDESMPHFHKSLRLLGNRQPSSRVGAHFKLFIAKFRQLFHVWFPEHSFGNPSKREKYLEQARCLSHMWHSYDRQQDTLRCLLSAIQQVNLAENAEDDLHELTSAYTNMMLCCQMKKWADTGRRYEQIAMRRCVDSPIGIGPDDLITIGHLYAVSTGIRLASGQVQGAIDTGYSALKISEKIHDIELQIQTLPLLANALLLAGRMTSCVEMLGKLLYAATEEEDSFARGAYYCCCLDLILEAGFALESHDACVSFCSKVTTDAAYAADATPRRYLMASLAVWYMRKDRLDQAKVLDRTEESLPSNGQSSFLAVRTGFKILECRLLGYCHAIKAGRKTTKVKTKLKKMMKALKADTRRYPGLKPRLHHLRAYMRLLNGSTRGARDELQRSLQMSNQAGNQHEASWAQHSMEAWFDPGHHPLTQDESWQRSTEQDLDWRVAGSIESGVVKYSLPLPR
ncbi:adenylate cyclase type 10-like [Patiria miniata]|uniref:Guanylate cyclase domain-containing protein n=1 Tax=Patiria miniata TaxID=46514 RepID=A0A914BI07_PATMI|nr:adenylate cyclase type 10-like [Patiria miniata]